MPGETAETALQGVPIEVGLTAYPSRRIPVRPKEIATEADPIARTFEITFSFDAPDDMTVLPGMTATIYATVNQAVTQLSIPASALASNERGDLFVWVVERPAMTVSRRAVTVGELSGDQIEIVDGLAGTETVAISAAQNLRDGMAVSEIAY